MLLVITHYTVPFEYLRWVKLGIYSTLPQAVKYEAQTRYYIATRTELIQETKLKQSFSIVLCKASKRHA